MDYSMILKTKLKMNAERMAKKNKRVLGKPTKTSYIFDDISTNFFCETYENIKNNAKWKRRLDKRHPSFKDRTKEMQSINSSDALLMNIFCHPDIFKWKGIKDLLGIEGTNSIEFGWNPSFENEKPKNPTEIDMKIGNHIFEAKLTETDFTDKEKRVVLGYSDFEKLFNKEFYDGLEKIPEYQLIRNILVAYRYDYRFTLLVDERRIDLIKRLMYIIKYINNLDLKKRINFITWQEIVACTGEKLKDYISKKYF